MRLKKFQSMKTKFHFSILNPRVVSNVFVAQLLFYYSNVFITHFLSEFEAKELGTKQSFQRFEHCLHLPHDDYSFRLALSSLLAKKKFNVATERAARKLISEAVNDYVSELEEKNTFNRKADEFIKQELINKLKSVEMSVMFHEEVRNDAIIEKIYEDVNGNETMSFIEMQIEMDSFDQKIRNEKETSWIVSLNHKSSKDVKYFANENILGKLVKEINEGMFKNR